MSTLLQIKRNIRKQKIKKIKNKELNQCPQKRGICRRLVLLSPRKPNSARRKVARVLLLSTKTVVYAYIPGEGHNLQKFAQILIRGGIISDLPGVHYTAIRGVLDLQAVLKRRQGRSKYGKQIKL
jgi:small subunit ribosomal protein S12